MDGGIRTSVHGDSLQDRGRDNLQSFFERGVHRNYNNMPAHS